MKQKPMPLNFSELRWRVEALHAKGYRRDRITGSYIVIARYHDSRITGQVADRDVKADFYDREDFLDFLEWNERHLIKKLSTELAMKALAKEKPVLRRKKPLAMRKDGKHGI